MCEPQHRLLRVGAHADTCSVVLDGIAARFSTTSSGARAIVGLILPGELVEMTHLHLFRADHEARMHTPGRIASVSGRDVRALAYGRPAIAVAFAMAAQLEAAIMREWFLNVASRAAPERIAHLLCELAYRLHGHDRPTADVFRLPLTQEQIGAALGITSVHVNRSMRRLQGEGWVQRASRGVHVVDVPALRIFSGFDEAYLQPDRQQLA